MNKYLVTFRGKYDASELERENPTQQLETLNQWNTWATEYNDKIVDRGYPCLQKGIEIDVTKNASNPAQAEVIGYSVIEAKDMQDAESVVNKHPYYNGEFPQTKVQIQELVTP